MGISAAEAFGLEVVGRASHGGQRWIVFCDGQYRHVVEESHFVNTGHAAREADDERRADDYTDWCHRGLWAKDDVAAEVAALCDLTHVHSSESGTCGRVDAAPVSYEVRMSDRVENTGLDCHRFATRDEAQMAADAVNADRPSAKAEVIEVAGEPTTTFAAWNDS